MLVAFPGVPGAAAPKSGALKVMTRNLYLGAELGPALRATTELGFITAVTQIWATVQATNFPERAEALADEIAETDPHVVGLQEVELWASQTPGQLPVVEYDFLQLLLGALEERGLAYEPAASVTNFQVVAPAFTATGIQFLSLTDRDVILTRADLPGDVFSVENARGENFESNLVLESDLLGEFEVLRGWTSIDVTTPAGTVRVINTHLERLYPPAQIAQGFEILEGPADTELPVVLLGDLNSAAGEGGVPFESDTPTYGNMLAAGFEDAWTLKQGDDPGFTCCHAEDLMNTAVSFTERIDFVLVRGNIAVASVQRIGDELTDRTPSGLWPTDHAGVRAVLLPG